MKIPTSSLELVDLRIYRKNYGVEVDHDMPKAIVIRNDNIGLCFNVIASGEIYPTFIRLPYSNFTSDGTEFGNKLKVVKKETLEEKGICSIVCNNKIMDEIKKKKYIELEELENIILESDLYFKDRIKIVEDRINNGFKKQRKLYKIAHNDWEKNCHYKEMVTNLRDEDRVFDNDEYKLANKKIKRIVKVKCNMKK